MNLENSPNSSQRLSLENSPNSRVEFGEKHPKSTFVFSKTKMNLENSPNSSLSLENSPNSRVEFGENFKSLFSKKKTQFKKYTHSGG